MTINKIGSIITIEDKIINGGIEMSDILIVKICAIWFVIAILIQLYVAMNIGSNKKEHFDFYDMVNEIHNDEK